ncbi:hypothetical protein ABK040_011511 [Willaertia magna]
MGQNNSGINATLLTCGHNQSGQLATEDFVDRYQLTNVKLPFPDWMDHVKGKQKIKKPLSIKKVSNGTSFMLLLTNRLNEVYVVGQNSEFQLGLSHSKPVNTLTKLDTSKFLQKGEKIIDIYGGTLVSYIIAKKTITNTSKEEMGDSIYWCGSPPLQNLYSQAKLRSDGASSNSSESSNNQHISFTRWTPEEGWKKNFRVKHFDCSKFGDDHCIVVNQFNQIFGRGSNAYHQYGANTKECQNFERLSEIKLKGYENETPDVKIVACGGYHSVIVTRENEFFCSGLNSNGQLGYDIEETQYEFIQPPNLPFKGRKITDVSLGLYHTVVVVDYGEIYCCGDGRYGQLGNNENKSINHNFIRLKLEGISPITGNYIRHLNSYVIGVGCGLTHTIVITSDRKVWRCGGNDFGQIFLQNELQTCSYSIVFESKCEINSVSCGGKFTSLYFRRKVPQYKNCIERHLDILHNNYCMKEFADISIKFKH